VVDKFPLGERTIEAATNPRYVMVAPLKDFSAGLLDLATKKIVVASKMATLDAFGSTYFRERVMANGVVDSPGHERSCVCNFRSDR